MNLDIDKIKELCTEASFERGERYLREGRVEILKASPTRITAVVQGREEYDVEVDLRKDISAECTCPYDWEGYCKHIVAVLLSILDRGDEIDAMMAKDASEKEEIDAMLEGADPEDMRRFLRREIEDLQPLKAHFMAFFSKIGRGKSLMDYRKEVGRLFREIEPYDGYIPYGMEPDFSSFEDLAQIYIGKRDFSEAAKIYQALFESIEERAEYLYDSEGYFVGKFSDFLNSYVVCLKDAGLDAEARRGLIKYLFDKYIGEEDYFQDEYLNSLEMLCTLQEDIEYWLNLLEAHVPEEMPGPQERDVENYRAAELITSKLRLLSALERKRDYYALVERFYRYVPNICLSYAAALREDEKIEQSVKVAEEGLSLFPDNISVPLREFLNEIYKSSDPEKYRESLLWLFLHTGEWTHYEALKRISAQEWDNIFAGIIDHFSQDGFNIDKIINIYLREGMYKPALKKILDSRSLFHLREHHGDLADRYPEEYFQAYRDLIHPFAGRETGRRHYQQVVSYLGKMGEIKGFEAEFTEFIDLLRLENKRRPAFIEEMKVF